MSLSVWPVPFLLIMRGLRGRAAITQSALHCAISNNCYCDGVTVSINASLAAAIGVLIQVSMCLFDPPI